MNLFNLNLQTEDYRCFSKIDILSTLKYAKHNNKGSLIRVDAYACESTR